MFSSLRLAFGMYSRIPMGNPKWSEKSQKYIMLFFPAVGIVIGAAEFFAIWACSKLGLTSFIRAAILLLIPQIITGGIHHDGLADTCDALASNAEPQKRREILKDTHAGAFAIIGLIIWFLVYYAFLNAVPALPPITDFHKGGSENYDLTYIVFFCLGFIVSRVLSALLSLGVKSATRGYVSMFRESAGRKVFGILIGILFLIVPAMFVFVLSARETRFILYPVILTALIVLFPLYTKRMALKKFEGTSGDIAGWFLLNFELLWSVLVYFLDFYCGKR